MNRLIGIYGASGCGRGIMPLARAMPEAVGAQLVFIDDTPLADRVNGHEIWTFNQFAKTQAREKQVMLAIAAPDVRSRLADKCAAAGLPIGSVRSADAIIMDDVEVGQGALISPYVTFTSNIRIGRCFHANLYSYVEHDCRIGDFVTFAPGVRCNGNVAIGDFAYIGAGAMIRQNLTVGAGAVVGMGAVVTKDVAPGAIVIGNPARPLEKK
ncbi:MAG: acetyltransferase [Rhizobiales bacterium 24-66-13]|nr:MAG: acetyltransferase [Rhizobiales bacterium 24-66-13]